MLDWQNIVVGLILLAASGYLLRRGVQRMRSFRARRGTSPCETGCGSCGEGQKESTRKESTTPRTVFVEIGRSRTLSRRDTR
ncbi:MAG TPA: FeoB-associated Cys-rich membrane protein [Pyrinomonadaceae bacterium]|jgi:hypothetical protein|nr:FeoB-associated Cys-rich membrane protein [Pyrinomonadaceae bacterium]